MRKLKVTELKRIDVRQFKASDKTPLTVVLDDVRSMYNVGSVFRTADSFRLEKIMLCGITACPPHPEIHKTALGAELSMEWKKCENTIEAVNKLHEEGYEVYALEQVEHSVPLQNFKVEQGKKYALILGNECIGFGRNCNMADCFSTTEVAIKIYAFGRIYKECFGGIRFFGLRNL